MNKIIDLDPESIQNGFANFASNLDDVDNKRILGHIENSFQLRKESLSEEHKNIIYKVINTYNNVIKDKNYIFDKEDFILSKQEINEYKEQEDILRYLIYRYKYNVFPIIKKIEDYPPNVQIELTSICNLRCIMCYQSDRTFSNKSNGFMGHMNYELFKKIIDELEGNVEAITFASRGEPTIHKEFEKCLKYCEGKFLGLKLNTNATMFTDKLIHTLLSSDLQTLVLLPR